MYLKALGICTLFFIAYSLLGIISHNHYQTYGYDLGINHQVVWNYSQFSAPITTIDHVIHIPKLFVHVELFYILVAPFYWIWSDARMLILVEAAVVVYSGMAVYLLAQHYKLHPWIQWALLLNYQLFYGVQNALWFPVHSAPFGAAFVLWFLYFFITKRKYLTLVFFLLAITAKENVAGVVFLIMVVKYFIKRDRTSLLYGFGSLMYLGFVFGIYFNFIVPGGYQFASKEGLLSSVDPRLLFNTSEKLSVYWYSFLSYGFLPLLTPFYLLPVFGNLASYFILGRNVDTAQGLFLQYRIELVPLLSWACIEAIKKYKILQVKWIGVYLVLCTLFVQYFLHLPLSYLAKSWFWHTPAAVHSMNSLIATTDKNVSLVAQNNIVPQVSGRKFIYTLYPEKKTFTKKSPCGQNTCDWFRWEDKPEYLLVDISPEWDIRHLLTQHDNFLNGLVNMEKAGVIKKYKQIGTSILYKCYY